MTSHILSAQTAPYTKATAVDLSSTDAAFTPAVPRALYVGVSGDVIVKLKDAPTTAVTFKAAPVGVLPVRAVAVVKTGTTATNLLALF